MVNIGDIIYVTSMESYVLTLHVTKNPDDEYASYIAIDIVEGKFVLITTTDAGVLRTNEVANVADIIDKNPAPVRSLSMNPSKSLFIPMNEIAISLVKGIINIYPDIEAVNWCFDKRILAMSKLILHVHEKHYATSQNRIDDIEYRYNNTPYRIFRAGDVDATVDYRDVIVDSASHVLYTNLHFCTEPYPYNNVRFGKICAFSKPEYSIWDGFCKYYVPVYSGKCNIEVGKVVVSLTPSGHGAALIALSNNPILNKDYRVIDIDTENDGLITQLTDETESTYRRIINARNLLFRRLGYSTEERFDYNSSLDSTNLKNAIEQDNALAMLALYAIDEFVNFSIGNNLSNIPDDRTPAMKKFLHHYRYEMQCIRKGYLWDDGTRITFPSLSNRMYLHIGCIGYDLLTTNQRYIVNGGEKYIYCTELPDDTFLKNSPMAYGLFYLFSSIPDDYPVQYVIGKHDGVDGSVLPVSSLRLKDFCVLEETTASDLRGIINEKLDSLEVITNKIEYPLYLIKDSTGWLLTIKSFYDTWEGDKECFNESSEVTEVQIDCTGHIIGDIYELWHKESIKEIHFEESEDDPKVFNFYAALDSSDRMLVKLGVRYVPEGISGARKLCESWIRKYKGKSYVDLERTECIRPAQLVGCYLKKIIGSGAPFSPRKVTVETNSQDIEYTYFFIEVSESDIALIYFVQLMKEAAFSNWLYDEIGAKNIMLFFDSGNTKISGAATHYRDSDPCFVPFDVEPGVACQDTSLNMYNYISITHEGSTFVIATSMDN